MLDAPLALLLTLATGKGLPSGTSAVLFLLGLSGRKGIKDIELGLLAIALATGKAVPSSPPWPSSPSSPSSRPYEHTSPGLPSGRGDWTPEEMAQFKRELAPLGVPLEELLLMLSAESGLDPHAQRGNAFGLNQAQPTLLGDAGWKGTGPGFASLNVSDQIPWLGRMLRVQFTWVGEKPQTAIDLFRMNLSPVAAKAHAEVIYDRSVVSQRPFYESNAQLDVTNDGRIDMADLASRLVSVANTPRHKRHLALLQQA
jgi:hypothetical protein